MAKIEGRVLPTFTMAAMSRTAQMANGQIEQVAVWLITLWVGCDQSPAQKKSKNDKINAQRLAQKRPKMPKIEAQSSSQKKLKKSQNWGPDPYPEKSKKVKIETQSLAQIEAQNG